MNRKQKRSSVKSLRKLGLNNVSAKQIVKNINIRQTFDTITEGAKVKINIENTEKGNPERNKWVEENKDKVFTVKYNPKYGDSPIMVEFEEYPLWLWCVNELIVVE